jgi:TatA/E family protein of Tat protein translocase
MGSIGMPEMLVILVIALIIFGPRKLPELGKSLGRSLAEFKRASNDLKITLEEEIRSRRQQQDAPNRRPFRRPPAGAARARGPLNAARRSRR